MYHKIRLIHAWAGMFLCLLLTVLGLSGSLLIVKDDYLRVSIPEARQVVSGETEIIGQAIEEIENGFDGRVISYVSLAYNDVGIHRIVFKDGGAAYTDQTGTVIKSWDKHGSVEDWIFHLHHYLFMGTFGKNLAGIAGLAAVIMALTGLYIMMPFLKGFAWRVWPKSLKRRDILASHRDLGLIFFLPILVLMITGAAMVFNKPTSAILAVVTVSEPVKFERPKAGEGDVDWVTALASAKQAFPDATLRLISWPREAGGTASVRMKQPNEWHQNGRTYAYIDPATSQATATKDANKLSRGERVGNGIYPLHSIAVGGRIYDIIGFLTGLIITFLGVMGSWTYIQILRKRRQKKKAARFATQVPS